MVFFKNYTILIVFQSIAFLSAEEIWTPKLIKQTLDDWKQRYPQLVRVATAQEMFGLPPTGISNDCPYDNTQGCENQFFTIQDFVTHPEGSESSSHLPEVFWSGALHGDENLGPTVVMESAAMLVEAAACEALPGPNADMQEISDAKDCREDLAKYGIDNVRRQWLARLVSTRRIVVVPTANSLGNFRDTRHEGKVDPDRDFPYNKEEDSCMRTIAARTVNELFQSHMFQIAISFHSGDGAIRWSWRRAPESSPDKIAQLQLAKTLTDAATGVARSSIYEEFRSPNTIFQYGNSLVDYVTIADPIEFGNHSGTFEDWAYGASWDSYAGTCSPESNEGYASTQTTYNNSTNRALAILASINVGKSQTETIQAMKGNIRLAMASADLVQPYVSVFGVNKVRLSDDIIPLTKDASKSCWLQNIIVAPKGMSKLTVEWTVGGAIDIEFTDLLYKKNAETQTNENVNCLTQPKYVGDFLHAEVIGNPYGKGYYSEDGPIPNPEVTSIKSGINGPVFKAEIPTKDFQVGDKIVVIARARVDQTWKKKHSDEASAMAPQSHFVNARTDTKWNHQHAGKIIEGRTEWYSVPVTIVLEDYPSTMGSIELYNRFQKDVKHSKPTGKSTDNPSIGKPIPKNTDSAKDVRDFSMKKLLWQFLVTLSSVLVVGFLFVRRARRRSELQKMQSVLHAEGFSDEAPSDPYVLPEDETIEFENSAIYRRGKKALEKTEDTVTELDGCNAYDSKESKGKTTQFETIFI